MAQISREWGQIFGNLLKAASFGTSTNTKLFKALKSRSEILRQISVSFVERGKNLVIYSFYETDKFPNMNCKVSRSPRKASLPLLKLYEIVGQDSAVVDWPNETSLGMNGNQVSICRFACSDDQGYRNVWTNLHSIVGAINDRS